MDGRLQRVGLTSVIPIDVCCLLVLVVWRHNYTRRGVKFWTTLQVGGMIRNGLEDIFRMFLDLGRVDAHVVLAHFV